MKRLRQRGLYLFMLMGIPVPQRWGYSVSPRLVNYLPDLALSGANCKAMGLFDKLFNPKTDSQTTNPGAALYHSIGLAFVTEIFKIGGKKRGSEIEAILFFSQLVRIKLVTGYFKTHHKVLRDFTDATVKDMLAKGIENYVANPTNFINSRAEFYWEQWVGYDKAVAAYLKTERPEKTERAFIEYLQKSYSFIWVSNLIYNLPLEQFETLPPISLEGDFIESLQREIKFLYLIARTSDAVQGHLDNLHKQGIL